METISFIGAISSLGFFDDVMEDALNLKSFINNSIKGSSIKILSKVKTNPTLYLF